MTTIIDTNIVITILNDSSPMFEWTKEQFLSRKNEGPLIIPDIVYCETSIGLASKEATDIAVNDLGLERMRTSDESLFRAGIAYMEYKGKNKGVKTGVLPDFLIGAMAETAEVPLMTHNEKDFVKYFPKLTIISPPKGKP